MIDFTKKYLKTQVFSLAIFFTLVAAIGITPVSEMDEWAGIFCLFAPIFTMTTIYIRSIFLFIPMEDFFGKHTKVQLFILLITVFLTTVLFYLCAPNKTFLLCNTFAPILGIAVSTLHTKFLCKGEYISKRIYLKGLLITILSPIVWASIAVNLFIVNIIFNF